MQVASGIAAATAYIALIWVALNAECGDARTILAMIGLGVLAAARTEDLESDAAFIGDFFVFSSLKFASGLDLLWILAFIMTHLMKERLGLPLFAIFQAAKATTAPHGLIEIAARSTLATIYSFN
jgi:hypothetical protein